MLHKRETNSSAVVRIDDEAIARGFHQFAGRGRDFDRTLPTQLASLLLNETPPDLYLFTAKSAVPVADALRGFFGNSIPALDHIAANHQSVIIGPQVSQEGLAQESEIQRLKELSSAAAHVCVVEQFSSSGRTLQYAGHVLRQAGVEMISGIRGAWYHDARPEDIDQERLTSSHATFMHQVGELAHEQFNQRCAQ